MSKLRLLLVLGILLLFSSHLVAQEKKQVSLAELRKKIAEENEKIDKIATAKKKLQRELGGIKKQLALLEKQDISLKQKLDDLIEEWKIVSARIVEIEDDLDQLKERAAYRLRVLYMTKPANIQKTLLVSGRGDDFPKISYLLSKVHAYDNEMVKRFSSLYALQRTEEERYEVLIREQKKVKQKIESQQLELQSQLKRKEGLEVRLNAQKAETETVLTKLRTHALRLETVLTSITDGRSVAGSLFQSEREKRKNFRPKEKLVSQDQYEGPGLKSSKGSLTVPIAGKVLRRFGKYKHKEFKDIVYSKGILFSAEQNSPVKAIARGRVMYFGRLPGYGTLVIVDHGQRSYSLYARLNDVRVIVGEIVDTNDIIGTTGKPDEENANFYFEIRKNGKPVNPQTYYTAKL